MILSLPIPCLATQPDVFQVLFPYWPVFVSALLVSFFATPLMRRLAIRHDVVDRPDLTRKIHTKPIAYLGGVAIFLGWLIGMAASFLLHHQSSLADPTAQHVIPLPPPSIIFGAAVITLVGLIDDVYGISPRVKIGGQFLAAAALASEKVGLMITYAFLQQLGIDNPPFLLCYILGTAVIASFVLGGCNALNLIDGLDGLAAGVSAMAMLGFLIISVYVAIEMTSPSPALYGADPVHASTRIIICLATLGAVLGFLPYNFNPASIFMGDAGSLLLGFLCVSTILMFAHTAQRGPGFVVAGLVVFGLPILDTILAIVRRKLRGQAISSADSQHLHHQVCRYWKLTGRSPATSVKLTALSLYLLSAFFILAGFLMIYLRLRWALLASMGLFAVLVFLFHRWGKNISARSESAAALLSSSSSSSPPPPPPTPQSPSASS